MEWRKRGAVPPDKPGIKAGERRCGPQVSNVQATRTVAKAASAAEERWLTAAADSGGVMTAARSEGLQSKLVKPSWSRGETPRSKVDAGNGDEGQRVAAGSVGAKNRR